MYTYIIGDSFWQGQKTGACWTVGIRLAIILIHTMHYTHAATDVWECSGGRGGVSTEPLGPVLPPHQHSGDCAGAEATGHCVLLPP